MCIDRFSIHIGPHLAGLEEVTVFCETKAKNGKGNQEIMILIHRICFMASVVDLWVISSTASPALQIHTAQASHGTG